VNKKTKYQDKQQKKKKKKKKKTIIVRNLLNHARLEVFDGQISVPCFFLVYTLYDGSTLKEWDQ